MLCTHTRLPLTRPPAGSVSVTLAPSSVSGLHRTATIRT
ncbi:hypothetical protein Hamer_G022360 [Homarus americanus]|uniref:Uncharacterized protein n=1 Tax=Homarus americanus TaxID=6706 RepID=A0A8J5JEP2_HOMAM|nr:hypothetical protein Hamer_G022360 [Homarus americanus]